ncbi:MAG: hypothetical protein F2954_00715 [Actinobacteria bacterium]|nr:hypothetical protein [Actinomycetota bacterium]
MMLGTLPNTTSSADEIPDEQYAIPTTPDSKKIGILFLSSLMANLAGYLSADATPHNVDAQGYSTTAQALCSSVDDAFCKAGVAIYYLAHLPTCLNEADIDCIAGMYAIKPDGTKVDGILLRGIPNKPSNPHEGNPILGIPRAGVDGLWQLPGVVNGSGSDTYLVIANQSGSISKEKGVTLNERIPSATFGAQIVPVKVLLGTYTPAYVGEMIAKNGTKRLAWYAPTGLGTEACAGVSNTECARRETFPFETVFGLSLRLSGEVKGWLHGRIRDPLIDYKSTSTITRITIQALPVSVPVVAGWTDRANLPAVIPGALVEPVPGTMMTGGTTVENTIALLKLWLPLLGDKAQANPMLWQFSSLQFSNLPGANSCMFDSKSLAGFVSTNSTIYTDGPPLYNSETGSIDYKLASPHFTRKGEVFKGVYNLTIRSDVARCIYKFTNAPITATISVTDESGQSSVAVESMSERDGWIYLSASGFTFSSPTVHVKLIGTPISASPIATPSPTPLATSSASPSPEATPIETPTPTPTPSVSSTKPVIRKSTIICLKGRLIKKITNINPKCPKGYKNK